MPEDSESLMPYPDKWLGSHLATPIQQFAGSFENTLFLEVKHLPDVTLQLMGATSKIN